MFDLVQVLSCSHANEAPRQSPVLSPLSYDFRTKAQEQFVSSLQADVKLFANFQFYLFVPFFLLMTFNWCCFFCQLTGLFLLFFVGNRWHYQYW